MSIRPASILLDPRLAAQRDESSASDLQQVVARVLSVLRRRQWLFIFLLLTGVLCSLLASMSLPRRYMLGAIFERRDDVVITRLVSDNSPYSFATMRQSLNMDLAGYNAVSQAVDQLGLTSQFPRNAEGELTPEGRARKQALVVGLSRDVGAILLEKGNFLDLIEVRYRGEDPDLGVRLVTQLKDNYIKNTRTRISDIVSKARDFFRQEVDKRSRQAAQIEAQLLDDSLKHPGVDPADPDVLNARLLKETETLEDLARRKAELESNLQARQDYLAQLNGAPASATATRPAALLPPSSTPRNPQWHRIRGEIQNVKAQIADAKMLKKMTDQHPFVVGLNDKLRSLEAQLELQSEDVVLAAEPAEAPTPADPNAAERRRLDMELKSLRETLARVDHDTTKHQAEKIRLEQEKGGLFERRQQFMVRQQELQTIKSDLATWNGHLETISRVMTAESEERGIRFGTVEDARRPAKPIAPSVNGILLFSFGVGLALAVGAVFVREIFDRSFRSAARVRSALGIPVLEVIGHISAGAPTGWLRRWRLLPVLASIESLAVLGVYAMVYLSVEQPAVFNQWAGRVAGLVNGS